MFSIQKRISLGINNANYGIYSMIRGAGGLFINNFSAFSFKRFSFILYDRKIIMNLVLCKFYFKSSTEMCLHNIRLSVKQCQNKSIW